MDKKLVIWDRGIENESDKKIIIESSRFHYRVEKKRRLYSSILRMGINGKRVDNASSGGITCGITGTGRLKPIAFSPDGRHYDVHPTSGIPFASIVVPYFRESMKLVEQLHQSFPLLRIISWDIAIGEDGTPILIEANLNQGQLDFHQLNNGPIFGDDPERILSEVKWEIPDLNR